MQFYIRYDCGASVSHVVRPAIYASLQVSIQIIHTVSLISQIGGPIFIQEVPLWNNVTLAPVQFSSVVLWYCDPQSFLWAQLGLWEIWVSATVVRRHRSHKVLQQVVAGQHKDGCGEEGYVHDLEAACAAHLLKEVAEPHAFVQLER